MLDIFDILGPVMIGPSSSHTAGAARIGFIARALLGTPPVKAAIHLYGSFAETGAGHGTDRALVGGLLGMKPDDERLPFAFDEAKKAGLTYTIDEIELRDAHPNTAVIEAWSADGKDLVMQAFGCPGVVSRPLEPACCRTLGLAFSKTASSVVSQTLLEYLSSTRQRKETPKIK